MGNRETNMAPPRRESSSQRLSRLYGLDAGGRNGANDEVEGQSKEEGEGRPEASTSGKEGGGAAAAPGSRELKWSKLSTAPMTTTTVMPELQKKQFGRPLTRSSSQSGESSSISDVEFLEQLRVKSKEDRTVAPGGIASGRSVKGDRHQVPSKTTKSGPGQEQRVKHVTFGGAWDVTPQTQGTKRVLRQSQLRQTSVQTTSVDEKGKESISDSSRKNNFKMKHEDK